jgi:hypothetical protein
VAAPPYRPPASGTTGYAALKSITPAVCRSRDGSGVFAVEGTAISPNPQYSLQIVEQRLTPDRLSTYRTAGTGTLDNALALYTWNVQTAAAFFELIGVLEVILRNTTDALLVHHAANESWEPWYDHQATFVGNEGAMAQGDIQKAKRRATYRGKRPLVHGRLIAELNLGFWRFLFARHYHTALWVPVTHRVVPHHPRAGAAQAVREDVFKRLQRINQLRNRIAHHEPIVSRNLARDHHEIIDLIGWICPDTQQWARQQCRVDQLLASRP